jgi:hypothetical protein
MKHSNICNFPSNGRNRFEICPKHKKNELYPSMLFTILLGLVCIFVYLRHFPSSGPINKFEICPNKY